MQNSLLKWRNRLIAFSFDIIMIPVSWFGAFWLLNDLHQFPDSMIKISTLVLIPLIVFQGATFCLFGLYRGVWRFASIPDIIRIAKAIFIGMLSIVSLAAFSSELTLAIPILYGLLLMALLTGARGTFRWLKDYRRFFQNSKRVLIVGAGYAGERLVRDLMRHEDHVYQPIIFVDDDPIKLGRDIHGIRVAGKCEQIPKIVIEYNIDLIIIAIPSASSKHMRQLINFCEQTKIPVRTLPGINDLANGHIDIRLLRNISLEDLLGRDQIQLDWRSISNELHDKTILVSGGGGSIGSELCRQIIPLSPKQLIIIDNCEFNLYTIEMELKRKFPYLKFQALLMDVNDKVGLEEIFGRFSPQIVFHAAAYKHVPLLEEQSRIAIHNNIIGTYSLANASVAFGVDKFVLISTDKAVNPANLMGATKRAAEIICQNLYDQFLTKFITVRFGNVLDSAGSVVPLFRRQIQEGGPITVTHPKITRYFMSIPEASQLIMQAAVLGLGGEIFVLDMGEPIKINYLAEQMSRLAGKTIGYDIDIEYTGLRPGEKLYEELFYKEEKLKPTTHEKILLAAATKIDKNILYEIIDKIEKSYKTNDKIFLYDLLTQIVPEYKLYLSKKTQTHFVNTELIN